jgi:dihydrofolate synthase/folylpolyglutamate synthase
MSNIATLSEWLDVILSRHPQHHIELGLDRIRVVFERMGIQPKCPIMTVTGTNGKGSTSAMIASILKEEGHRVGLYLSPHLLRYNERININGAPVEDRALCEAFDAVEAARVSPEPVDLTYFEFGTLAAFWLFERAKLDVWVLEVGLGGRFDAVNVLDADVAVVTAIDVDHALYLGDTRDAVGFEKAHIARAGRPLICGERNPPPLFIKTLNEIGAKISKLGRDFDAEFLSADSSDWAYVCYEISGGGLSKAKRRYARPALNGAHQFGNAAMALTAIYALPTKLSITDRSISRGLSRLLLPCRVQTLSETPKMICDVAHNPHAAVALKSYLDSTSQGISKTIAIFAMLADKDIEGVVEKVKDAIDEWHIAPLPAPRGADTERLLSALTRQEVPVSAIVAHESVKAAFDAQKERFDALTKETARIVVFGSFLTAAEAVNAFNQQVV